QNVEVKYSKINRHVVVASNRSKKTPLIRTNRNVFAIIEARNRSAMVKSSRIRSRAVGVWNRTRKTKKIPTRHNVFAITVEFVGSLELAKNLVDNNIKW
uniref:Uncharacterized protein n=1 Tax=Romanomermis culicivorax TaxID=13658 RepID=A0A915J2R1_ROMCU